MLQGVIKENAKQFYDKVSKVLSRLPLDACKILNMGETGIASVLNQTKL
jgi:hypothetical protein